MLRFNFAVLSLLVCTALVAAEAPVTLPLGNNSIQLLQLDVTTPSKTVRVTVPQLSNSLIVDVTSQDVVLDVNIVQPDGTPVAQEDIHRLTLTEEQVPPLGAFMFRAGEHAQLSVAHPQPGDWMVTASLPVGASDTIGTVTTVITGGLTTSVMTSRPSYQSGETVVIAVPAAEDGFPVLDATVTVSVTDDGADAPDGTPTPVRTGIALLDNGIPPDADAGDGLYTAAVDELDPGHYLVTAQLHRGGQTLRSATDFLVTPSLGLITGDRTDSGIDTNGDGLFEFIEISLDVQIDEAGAYGLSVELKKDGQSMHAGTASTLPAGLSTMAVKFEADKVKRFLGVDGPYIISLARLTRNDDTLINLPVRLADERTDLGSTQAYSLDQLQRPKTVILSGVRDSAVDVDGNGLFDSLSVKFDVDLLVAGNYRWSADLRSPDGVIVGVANSFGFLNVGVNELDLQFSGVRIGETGLDGPYTLGNAAVYGPPGVAGVRDKVGVTAGYLASAFEGFTMGASFAALLAEVEALDISGVGGADDPEGIRKGLLNLIRNAERSAERDSTTAATNQLNAVISQLEAQSGQHIAEADATYLIGFVQQLINSL